MIVFATCEAWPEPLSGLKVMIEKLERKGAQVRCIPWQQECQNDFLQAHKVIPLCVWDYARFPEKFIQWIESLKKAQVPVFNHPDLIFWNIKKEYLLTWGDLGLNVPKTLLIKQPTVKKIKATIEQQGWDDVVMKPLIGQSGHGVERFSSCMTDQNMESCQYYAHGLLLQPFYEQIIDQGELSFCFIAGRFSHAICRYPQKGQWRGNSQYGARVQPVDVDEQFIRQAEKFLSFLPHVPLYARIDGLVIKGQFMLCEMELIEPALFFDHIEDLEKTLLVDWVEFLIK